MTTLGRKPGVSEMPKHGLSLLSHASTRPNVRLKAGAGDLRTSDTNRSRKLRLVYGLNESGVQSPLLYCGRVDNGRCVVTVSRMAQLSSRFDLQMRTDLHCYSNEFGWGGHSRQSFQLALALLASALDSDHRALSLHERFAMSVIAELPMVDSWMLTQSYLEHWAATAEDRLGIHWVSKAGAYLEEINS